MQHEEDSFREIQRSSTTLLKQRVAGLPANGGFESRPPLHDDNETGDREAPCLCLLSVGSRRD